MATKGNRSQKALKERLSSRVRASESSSTPQEYRRNTGLKNWTGSVNAQVLLTSWLSGSRKGGLRQSCPLPGQHWGGQAQQAHRAPQPAPRTLFRFGVPTSISVQSPGGISVATQSKGNRFYTASSEGYHPNTKPNKQQQPSEGRRKIWFTEWP